MRLTVATGRYPAGCNHPGVPSGVILREDHGAVAVLTMNPPVPVRPNDPNPRRVSAVEFRAVPALVVLVRAVGHQIVTSGFRIGEIQGIRINRIAVDATPRHILSDTSCAAIGTKGENASAQLKEPKPKSSKRIAPLHRAAEDGLREWLEVGWAALVGRRPTPEDFLLPRPDGQPSRPRVADQIREDLRAAGLPDTADGNTTRPGW